MIGNMSLKIYLKKKMGKAIDYTVSEQPVKGYKTKRSWYNYC